MCLLILAFYGEAQTTKIKNDPYWNSTSMFNTYWLPVDPNAHVDYIDLDGDGDPDVLKTMTPNGFPVQWIDDDDDMKKGDSQGDIDSDCLMVDRNKDGEYASYGDVVVDWVDNEGDGAADMQIYGDYAREDQKDAPWGPGHLMINIDTDHDHIMNYIDWNTFHLRGWIHDGQADFYEDYQGKSLFLKIHTSPEKMNDPRLNWENPFLFYDPDNDGLTEYAIRVIDSPVPGEPGDEYMTRLTGKVSWISMAYDLDNDNGPGSEFDFDMTVSFRGEGFSYMDQVHSFPKMRGLPESDQYFMDPRVRQLTELIYPDHASIHDLIFNRGKWDEVYFAYDEDDDCKRWERVELYDPLDPYKTGIRNGGLDNNAQADAVGNRGEWDLDNSGSGKLYVGKFDGRIHLYGAELGYWRIDQNAYYYHGMGGLYDGYGPERLSRDVESPFPIVKYTDTNNNGFFDTFEYDLDGDTIFEEVVSLKDLGIDDHCAVLEFSNMEYDDLTDLKTMVAKEMWQNAMDAVAVAKKTGIETNWYAMWMSPKSNRQKYHNGYWLQFYLYRDLVDTAKREGNARQVKALAKAYYSGNWKGLKL
jgi:hypothetical protein